MTGNEMWNMALFEQRTVEASSGVEWRVLRVPGGWVMREMNIPNAAHVFIPLNNEFVV